MKSVLNKPTIPIKRFGFLTGVGCAIAMTLAMAISAAAQNLVSDPAFEAIDSNWEGWEGAPANGGGQVPSSFTTVAAGVVTVTPGSDSEWNFYQSFGAGPAGNPALSNTPTPYKFSVTSANDTTEGTAHAIAFVKAFDGGWGFLNSEYKTNNLPMDGSTVEIDFVTDPAATFYQVGVLTVGTTNGSYDISNPILEKGTAIPLDVEVTIPSEGDTVSSNGFYFAADGIVFPGTITNVDFYLNGGLVGNATAVPSYVWVTGAPLGAATLQVVAMDDFGASVTSAPVNVTVVSEVLETVFTVDPAANWGGWMNVYELQENFGGFAFGSAWGVQDLTAEFSGYGSDSILTLKPAPITLGPGSGVNGYTNDAFWYYYNVGSPENTNGALGFKSMEANLVVTVDGENGNLIRFRGTNVSAALLSATNGSSFGENSWTCEAYIKDLDPDFGTNTATEVVVPVTDGESFDISLQTFPDAARHIQYGLRLRGPNVWPGDEDAYGTVVLKTDPVAIPVTNAFTVDPSAPWVGHMNVFESPANGGGYVFGQAWGVADLQAEFVCPEGLVLRAAGIDDPSAFWYLSPPGGPGSTGNKTMEAVMHVADDSLVGSVVQFSGTVVSAGLLAAGNTNAAGDGWSGVAFIRDFDPGYGSFNEATAPLTPGSFDLELQTDTTDPGRHVQYGFIITGPNVWPTDVESFGDVVIETSAAIAPVLTATLSGGNVDLSFCTQTGFSYQVEYKDDATDASWSPLGAPVAGSDGTETVSDAATHPDRYYRLSVQ